MKTSSIAELQKKIEKGEDISVLDVLAVIENYVKTGAAIGNTIKRIVDNVGFTQYSEKERLVVFLIYGATEQASLGHINDVQDYTNALRYLREKGFPVDLARKRINGFGFPVGDEYGDVTLPIMALLAELIDAMTFIKALRSVPQPTIMECLDKMYYKSFNN
ncbi:MAG: hypothetical protein UT18_C0010G0009 [candidate division CPR2 bacterium GW2011_GWC2_39_10]|uniref:Uncharacterized protein n=1 Tax=candidate division CPR2 bacterium GW2011_GWC2_39_10 TaxID=1618345 RepID=A0A0G0LTT5_UNCC2|nr:MAG: hypothetical protein UT18_C0010G0009 [candidate division CPR2 bacterium GW2011_GWC2_39_10]